MTNHYAEAAALLSRFWKPGSPYSLRHMGEPVQAAYKAFKGGPEGAPTLERAYAELTNWYSKSSEVGGELEDALHFGEYFWDSLYQDMHKGDFGVFWSKRETVCNAIAVAYMDLAKLHGGVREGAGRPNQLGESKLVSFDMPVDLIQATNERRQALGGISRAEYFRQLAEKDLAN